LLSDAIALAKAGSSPINQYITLLSWCAEENNYCVFSSMAKGIRQIRHILQHRDDLKEKFDKFVFNLVKPIAKRLGNVFTTETHDRDHGHLTTLFRASVLSMLIIVGDPETVEQSRNYFNSHVDRQNFKSNLPPDLRFSILKLILHSGGEDEYEAVLKIYRNTDLAEERRDCLRSLGYTSKKELLLSTLDFSLTEDVRSQDLFYVVANVAVSGVLGNELAWEWFRNNFHSLMSRYGSGQNFIISALIGNICGNFISQERADEVQKFFEENKVPTANKRIQQSVETIRIEAGWLQRDGHNIAEFLASHERSLFECK